MRLLVRKGGRGGPAILATLWRNPGEAGIPLPQDRSEAPAILVTRTSRFSRTLARYQQSW